MITNKLNIPIRNFSTAKISQNLCFFTEELWAEQKEKYQKTIPHFFSGKKGEVHPITHDDSVFYLIGLGKENVQNFEIQRIAASFAQGHKTSIQAVSTKIFAEFFTIAQLQELVNGLFLGTYQYPFAANHPFWDENFELIFENAEEQLLQHISEKSSALCQGQFIAMEWLNKPANLKHTPQIVDFLEEISAEYNLSFKAYNKAGCESLGLGAFLSVNQGSAYDCAFTILEYKSGDPIAKTLGLVGKCVVFDTGGISLKNPDNMHYMKSDMGGATAVIGTLITCAQLKLPINIIAILPITDNAISANAYLPSDVVKSYNGKTIEVLNTDAEGRMTLADGLSYLAKNYKTDALVDLATLTGSSVRMFGDTCGALFSNNESLKNALILSGDQTNQRLWNLPLWDIWKEDFRSDVADLKNISLKPIGDCIVAAKFLEQFTENHDCWAHLDIAGVAFGNVNYAKEKAATGYGVQLLLHFIENFS